MSTMFKNDFKGITDIAEAYLLKLRRSLTRDLVFSERASGDIISIWSVNIINQRAISSIWFVRNLIRVLSSWISQF